MQLQGPNLCQRCPLVSKPRPPGQPDLAAQRRHAPLPAPRHRRPARHQIPHPLATNCTHRNKTEAIGNLRDDSRRPSRAHRLTTRLVKCPQASLPTPSPSHSTFPLATPSRLPLTRVWIIRPEKLTSPPPHLHRPRPPTLHQRLQLSQAPPTLHLYLVRMTGWVRPLYPRRLQRTND